jgi:hypothetical protein
MNFYFLLCFMSFPWTFRLKEASNLLFCPGLGRSAEWRPRSAAMPAKWRVWKHHIEDMHVIIKVWHIHEEIEQKNITVRLNMP